MIERRQHDQGWPGRGSWRSERRDISKGQQAMRLALLYPETKRGMHFQSRNGTEKTGISKQRLSQARSVLAFDEQDQSVLGGVGHIIWS